MTDDVTKHSIALPWERALEKTFWPVLGEIWEDLKKLYAAWRDNILIAGYKKIVNKDDWKKANLRVTRDVFRNGSFTDEAICAEYFWWILASSRSDDWRDDNAIQYVDVIKSLSSRQLHLHYVIYNSLNKILIRQWQYVNVLLSSDIQSKSVRFFAQEILSKVWETAGLDLNILYKQWLLIEYKTQIHQIDDSHAVQYMMAKPTTFWVLLYAMSHNKFNEYSTFSSADFWNFDEIILPEWFAWSLEELLSFIA